MFVIVGLGNPGMQYAHTRHNAGFDALEILSKMWNIPIRKSGFRAKVGEGTVAGQRVVLAKPQTYMNDSGLCVVELLNWYKPPIHQLIVIYDDIDLPLGNLRVRGSGSAGTHNGMRSIIRLTGREDFPRVRVGIGKPNHELRNYVLERYSKQERPVIAHALEGAATAAELILREGVESAMQKVNTRNPARETP